MREVISNMNYLNELQRKVNKYKNKYVYNNKKIAIKLIWWNLVQLFNFRDKSEKISENINRIALYFSGGIGDILIGFNYACYLREYLKKCNVSIDIYVNNVGMVKALDGGSDFNIYSNGHQESSKYLLKIGLVRYPQILEENLAQSKYRKNEKLLELVEVYRQFYANNTRFFEYLPFMDGMTNQYSLINGQKRIQQPDIESILNISCDFKYSPKILHEKRILNNLGLEAGSYITINRGVDNQGSVIESTKLWSLASYNKLVKLIKDSFENLKIIQLGASTERCELIQNVDINLVGETSLDGLKVLLKNSILHIDSEGGMVHLRKALNGGVSIVIFGPTLPDFYGYPTNINISSKACPFSCEWLNETWSKTCINSINNHICMESISPYEVFKQVEKVLKRDENIK
jgi:ADP-heptose:LPS heptosyltransferase